MAGPQTEPSATPPPDDEASEEAARRTAQDAATELARMGIDPAAVGLVPVPPQPAPPPHVTAPPQGAGSGGARHRSWIQPFQGTPPSSAPGHTPQPEAATVPGSPPLPTPAGPPRPSSPPAPERHGIVVPAGWRRLVRAVTLGVVTSGAAEAMAVERRLVARARTRQREPRVVALLAGNGGVGTTTTALGVAATLAALRNDPAVLVDARVGAASLAQRVVGRPAPTALEVSGAAPDAPAVEPLPLPSGLHVVDGAPWHSPPSRAEFVRLLNKFPARFPFTVVDVGNEATDGARGALSLATRVVLVTSPTIDAVDSVRTALARIVQSNPTALASVVVALVCRSRTAASGPVARRLTGELGLSHVVPVPYDRSLARGRQVAPARMRPVTREAYLALAAHVADAPHTGLPTGPTRMWE